MCILIPRVDLLKGGPMQSILIALAVFLAGYVLNVFYITVFYHRGLTHRALTLRPFMVKFVAWTGPWVTGIDPKGWICMHRMHHLHSDSSEDPHSPLHFGVFGVALGQLRSYEKVLRGLVRRQDPYTRLVNDLPFEVNFLNRRKLWWAPYLMHLAIGISVGFFFGQPLAGVAYFLGMMSHPVQGWMVNSLAHKYGYRNFSTDDNSKNNHLVAWLVVGEGYQNNHHAYPRRSNFAIKPGEVDFGYWFSRAAIGLGLATDNSSMAMVRL